MLKCSISHSIVDTIYAVAFCPYIAHDEEPIFAFTVQRETVVCRLNSDNDDSFEILRWFQDEDVRHSTADLSHHDLRYRADGYLAEQPHLGTKFNYWRLTTLRMWREATQDIRPQCNARTTGEGELAFELKTVDTWLRYRFG